jgi:hypothetical protein
MADLDRKSAQFSFRNVFRHHGVGIRGADLSRRSEQYEGRFGRMFRTLPPAEHLQADLSELAKQMTAEPEEPPTSENEFDPEENRGISSGYTYWGQFIDHDLTFDPASSLQKTNDPDGLTDFRTPRFDLDSVYGRGPDDQPYLYEDDGIRLRLSDRKLTGNGDDGTFDLQRNAPKAGQKRALIGDPRNDENVIVSQLQGIFIRFHNRVAALTGAKFAEVQRIVRWHYQWAVLHDFLRTIVGDDTLLAVLPHLKNDTSIYDDKPELRFFHWRNEPFMPVEFSVAAYRFGHSMIRPEYRLNSTLPGRFPIFSTTEKDLRGFDEFPDNWAIDWTLFFRFRPDAPVKGKNRVQPAYKIDSSLVSPLGNLPAVIAVNPAVLAERNLLRGLSMSLPSGQTVARHMCIPPIDDAHLRLGKLTNEDFDKNPLLVDRFPNFRDNAPLWYYILAEVQQQFIKGDKKDETPLHLGPVGGRIVAEVFAGLILGDNHSFLAQQPCWRPLPQLCRDGKHFGIADLITFARSK